MKRRQTTLVVIAAGMLVMFLTGGVGGSFGLFLIPMTEQFDWSRGTFSFARALSMLLMGALSPFMGAFSDRYGATRVVFAGALIWVAGLLGMAYGSTAWQFIISGGVVVGIATGAAGLSVCVGTVSQIVPDNMRSRATGLVTSGAALGQALMIPGAFALITLFGWQSALLALAATMILMIFGALGLYQSRSPDIAAAPKESAKFALGQAMRSPGFWLLTGGFLICGVNYGFILVHLPAELTDRGLSPATGAMALFLLNLANIFSTYAWGYLGTARRKKYLLSILYALRSGFMILFVSLPLNPTLALILSVGLGIAWFGTVPLTSGLVGQIFGVRSLGLLFGFVFFGHQMGAFVGSWLAGAIYDNTGSYAIMWAINIALGLTSAMIHLPINDSPLKTQETVPA